MYNKGDYKKFAEILKIIEDIGKSLEAAKSHLHSTFQGQPERAIKVMQQLYNACRDKDKLQFRFILSNKQ